MTVRIEFTGPRRYRLRSLAVVTRSLRDVGWRRARKGPRLPGWTFMAELRTLILKRQLAAAFAMADVKEARRYLDSMVLHSPAMSRVDIVPVTEGDLKGDWFTPTAAQPERTLLYLHGGGYSFYPKSYASLIAQIALATKCRTFALDYRLSPEHRYPAQLEDALRAYRWLLERGANAEELVVGGDSAGGNLTLALLQAARSEGLPLPVLAFALSPATDFADRSPSVSANQEFDWIDAGMAECWAGWFCDAGQRCDPLVSPLHANLRGLPAIYIQAGRAEILYDSIRAFAERARAQGADVVLESWDEMTHDFQMLGEDVPQSREALRRLGEVVQEKGVVASG